jgi:hypothetical protein
LTYKVKSEAAIQFYFKGSYFTPRARGWIFKWLVMANLSTPGGKIEVLQMIT